MGTPEDPFTGTAEIILHGGVRSEELPVYGSKVLGVRNGTLEMHGKYKVYWQHPENKRGTDENIFMVSPSPLSLISITGKIGPTVHI